MAGIATEAVKAARQAGIRAEELLAALGPSIGPCCYEVSEELGDEFERAGLPVQAPRGRSQPPVRPWQPPSGVGAKPRLDLREANRVLLEQCGVPARNVQLVGPCTRCSRDRYHSFRAEPESAGRQVSWIGWLDREDRRRARDRAPTR